MRGCFTGFWRTFSGNARDFFGAKIGRIFFAKKCGRLFLRKNGAHFFEGTNISYVRGRPSFNTPLPPLNIRSPTEQPCSTAGLCSGSGRFGQYCTSAQWYCTDVQHRCAWTTVRRLSRGFVIANRRPVARQTTGCQPVCDMAPLPYWGR